VQASRCYTVLL